MACNCTLFDLSSVPLLIPGMQYCLIGLNVGDRVDGRNPAPVEHVVLSYDL